MTGVYVLGAFSNDPCIVSSVGLKVEYRDQAAKRREYTTTQYAETVDVYPPARAGQPRPKQPLRSWQRFVTRTKRKDVLVQGVNASIGPVCAWGPDRAAALRALATKLAVGGR